MTFNYRYYFSFLILIWVEKSVDAINFTDIHDINNIKKFIDGITYKTPTRYSGQVLSNDEKSVLVFQQAINVLRNLRDLTDGGSSVTGYFKSSLEFFYERSFNNINHTVLEFIETLDAFDKTTNRINSYEEKILSWDRSFGFRMVDYCYEVSSLTRNIDLEDKEDILNKYQQIEDLWWKVYKIERNSRLPAYLISTPCGKRILSEQLFYRLYQQMVGYYLKEYIIRYFVDVVNSQCPYQNLPRTKMDKSIVINRLYEKEVSMSQKHFKFDFLYRCDPPNYDDNNGKKYYELSKMAQAVILPEKNLDIYQSCSHNCNLESIRDSINYTECDGYQDCQYIDSSYEICEPPASDHSSRRYQWFKDEHANVYGNNSAECKTAIKTVSSALKIFKFRSCDYCLCTCIKKKPLREDDVLFVSFREQVTDLEKNKVISGVRFVKKSNMIHVQIKEVELGANGLAKWWTSKWKELEHIGYNKSTENFYVMNYDNSQFILKEDIDYGRPERMYLEELTAPPGFVITGVAFQCSKEPISKGGCSGSLELKIRVTPYDYFTGRLIRDNQTEWFVNKRNSSLKPTEVQLDNSDVSTKSPKNRIDWTDGDYVQFQRSDLSKDAGQSTVPFFDAQDVIGDLQFPLGAIGVVHRGHRGYGGFLAFKINIIDTAGNFKIFLNE